MATNKESNGAYSSKSWIRFRMMKIMQSGGVCQICKSVFSDTSKLIVHHIIELKKEDYGNPHRFFDEKNTQVICQQCHNRIHDRFKSYRKVYIVFGSPFSGKSTFVKMNKSDDDIVFDFDEIRAAITLQPSHTLNETITKNVYKIRDEIFDQIKTRFGAWRNAWIIGTYSNQYEREQLARQFDAQLVYCDASIEECVSRLERCTDPRSLNKDLQHRLIEKWFVDNRHWLDNGMVNHYG